MAEQDDIIEGDMTEVFVTVITRKPDEVDDYLGFGFKEIERGRNSFNDPVIILKGPLRNANWQAGRLGSGLHGARIVRDQDELDAWKKEWGYVSSGNQDSTEDQG